MINGPNSYAYVGGNPANRIDSTGLWWPIVLGIWAAIEAGLQGWDTVETGKTLANPTVSTPEKLAAGGLYLAGLGLPGAGYGTGAKIVCKTAKNGETPFTIAGRAAHKVYNPGQNYRKNVTLPSGGKPDAVNFNARIVRELKPNNPDAIRRGWRQVERYREELEEMLGGDWESIVDTYDR